MITNKQYRNFSILVIFTAILLISGILLYHQDENLNPKSTFDFNPTPILSPTKSPEPKVDSWKEYSNDKFFFKLDVPSEWYIQDYSSSFHNGGTLVAFSPDPLPCETCTYLQNGYFSVRVFNKNSDEQLYTLFLQQVKSVERNSNYQKIFIDNKIGISSPNSVAVEIEGWVYEISFDKDQGNATIEESQIFKKVLSSFKYNNVLFSN